MNILTATMAVDALAFIDITDSRVIRLFDPTTGKSLNNDVIKMRHEIKQIALSQHDYPGISERTLAIVDKNRDLYLTMLKKFGAVDTPRKLAVMAQSIFWHTESPILAVIRDGKLRVYYYPNVIYIDPTLLDFTWEDKDLPDLGRSPELLSYESNRISIRRPDGVVIVASASPFAAHLHSHAIHGKFVQARRICRYVNEKVLWGTMAGLCAWKGELDLAEICYAEIGHFDKVFFVQDIKENTPDEAVKKAQMALLSGGINESENILLQAGKISQAVQLNINCHRWERALELALKYKVEMENVLAARRYYLEAIHHKETLSKFLEIQASPNQMSAKKSRKREKSDKGAKNQNQIESVADLSLPPVEDEDDKRDGDLID
jgi:intraflagellar transport protein 80